MQRLRRPRASPVRRRGVPRAAVVCPLRSRGVRALRAPRAVWAVLCRALQLAGCVRRAMNGGGCRNSQSSSGARGAREWRLSPRARVARAARGQSTAASAVARSRRLRTWAAASAVAGPIATRSSCSWPRRAPCSSSSSTRWPSAKRTHSAASSSRSRCCVSWPLPRGHYRRPCGASLQEVQMQMRRRKRLPTLKSSSSPRYVRPSVSRLCAPTALQGARAWCGALRRAVLGGKR